MAGRKFDATTNMNKYGGLKYICHHKIPQALQNDKFAKLNYRAHLN